VFGDLKKLKHKKTRQNKTIMNLSNEQLYKKIEEIYSSEKGKPFIAHLTRSFLPLNRSTFMLSNEKKKLMKCAITGTPLIHKEELIKFQLENVDAILKNFGDRLLGNTTENLLLENFKGKMLAVESEKSDKLLCLQAVHQLLNFASSEYLKGNKHIGYILKDENRKEVQNQSNNSPIVNQTKSDKPQLKQQPQQKSTVVHSTTSLGDFDVLKNLKEKLEKNESN